MTPRSPVTTVPSPIELRLASQARRPSSALLAAVVLGLAVYAAAVALVPMPRDGVRAVDAQRAALERHAFDGCEP